MYRGEWVSCFVSHVSGNADAEEVTVTFSNGERQSGLHRADLMFPPSHEEDAEELERTQAKKASEEKQDRTNDAATKVQAVWRGRQVQKEELLKPQYDINDNSAQLANGEIVSVNYHGSGNYYPGKIVGSRRQLNGKFRYEILYDDGDMESDVPRTRIVPRTLEPSPVETQDALSNHGNANAPTDGKGDLQKFDPVSVDYHSSGNYYPGKIAQVVFDEDTAETVYDILYEDGDVEAAVPRHRIVPLGQVGGAPVSFEPVSATSNQALDNSDDAPGEDNPRHDSQPSIETKPSQVETTSSADDAPRDIQSQNGHASDAGDEAPRHQTPREVTESASSAPMPPFRAKVYDTSGSSLSEARRLMRSALALDLLVEWISCWGGGSGGGATLPESAIAATRGLEALTHPSIQFSVPGLDVYCSGIDKMLEYRTTVLKKLGLLSFDSARVVEMTDSEITVSCQAHEFDTRENLSDTGPTGQPCLHTQITMTLTRLEGDKGATSYVATSCTFDVVWRSLQSGLKDRRP
eukprot:INCI1180.1.p1 GENE.INCI1180.1~~INCI1180.1.p1  ORF type:complete len:602 (-),score=104.63 INCI1180.1:1638-3200(-)